MMFRILRAASLIMGVITLIITIGVMPRDGVGDLNRVLLWESFGKGMFESYSLSLLQPETGRKIELVQRAWEYFHIVGWASDGALIYLEGGNDVIPMLMRVESDGTGRKLLVQKTSDVDKPAAWLTQNREWIVYLDFEGDIGAIRTDGSGQAILNPATDGRVFLSAIENEWVAFQLERSRELYWIRLGETELHQTYTPPTIGNDYQKLPLSAHDEFIVGRYGRLFWLNPATGNLRVVVTDNVPQTDGYKGQETYIGQNDAAGLVYVSFRNDEQPTKLWAVRSTDGRLVWEQPDGFPFDFSPDGRWLVVGTSDGRRFMLDAMQGTPHDLPAPFNGEDARAFSWSPDSQWLLLDLQNNWQGAIWQLNIATGETQRIFEWAGEIFGIYWSPDSRQIIANTPFPNGSNSLRMNADGSQVETLIHWMNWNLDYAAYVVGWGPPLEKKAWSKDGLFMIGGGLCIAPFVMKKRRNRERAVD